MQNWKIFYLLKYITDTFVDEEFPRLLSSMIPNLYALCLKLSLEDDIMEYFLDHCPN